MMVMMVIITICVVLVTIRIILGHDGMHILFSLILHVIAWVGFVLLIILIFFRDSVYNIWR